MIENRFEFLLEKALKRRCTDIHFDETENATAISMRCIDGLVPVKSVDCDSQLLHYLQFHAHLDLSDNKPQSGSFSYFFHETRYDFRLAMIRYNHGTNCVLRILNHPKRKIEELTCDETMQQQLLECLNHRSGLILFSGLTGCGKTTTIYSLLALNKDKIIYSLEDPIEAAVDNVIQLQINETIHFGYEEGLRQILRHNPDLLMIGEIRDEISAKMAMRAALSGTLVIASIHSGSTVETLYRLKEFGLDRNDLKQMLKMIFNQRLCRKKGSRDYTCIYEKLNEDDINKILDGTTIQPQMNNILKQAYAKGWIEEATYE